jgi:hypothetical protein
VPEKVRDEMSFTIADNAGDVLEAALQA